MNFRLEVLADKLNCSVSLLYVVLSFPKFEHIYTHRFLDPNGYKKITYYCGITDDDLINLKEIITKKQKKRCRK